MMNQLIYVTTNPGKIAEINSWLSHRGIMAKGLDDLGLPDLQVEETGQTLGDNAALKVQAYLALLAKQSEYRGQRLLLLADDTGIEIDGLNGEPGIRVRRWIGRKMGDEEIIVHTLERMKTLQDGQRGAKFRTVLALGVLNPDGTIEPELRLFTGQLRGVILKEPATYRVAGFPFESLFYVLEWKLLLGAVHRLSPEEKVSMMNHRERALEQALSVLHQELNR